MQGEVDQPMQMVLRVKHPSSLGGGGEEEAGEASSRSALSVFKAKEEQIERKKMEVREKVFAQLGRVEEESKRLAFIRQELEGMADPTRKEVEVIRKRIDVVNRQLKPLGKTCVKKEKEYKEILEAYNEKNKEKALLVNRLIEVSRINKRLSHHLFDLQIVKSVTENL
uniref:RAB6-interacting golgin n=1 Tax=Oryza glaberrima TaxID=4538 RepID=I1PKZ6_ORYGL